MPGNLLIRSLYQQEKVHWSLRQNREKRGYKILESFRRLGWWRSPVAHLHGVQEVAGSNPVHPTASAEVLKLLDRRGHFYTDFPLQYTAVECSGSSAAR